MNQIIAYLAVTAFQNLVKNYQWNEYSIEVLCTEKRDDLVNVLAIYQGKQYSIAWTNGRWKETFTVVAI